MQLQTVLSTLNLWAVLAAAFVHMATGFFAMSLAGVVLTAWQ